MPSSLYHFCWERRLIRTVFTSLEGFFCQKLCLWVLTYCFSLGVFKFFCVWGFKLFDYYVSKREFLCLSYMEFFESINEYFFIKILATSSNNSSFPLLFFPWIAGSCSNFMLNCLTKHKTVSTMATPFYIPTRNVWGFQFLKKFWPHLCQHLLFSLFKKS